MHIVYADFGRWSTIEGLSKGEAYKRAFDERLIELLLDRDRKKKILTEHFERAYSDGGDLARVHVRQGGGGEDLKRASSEWRAAKDAWKARVLGVAPNIVKESAAQKLEYHACWFPHLKVFEYDGDVPVLIQASSSRTKYHEYPCERVAPFVGTCAFMRKRPRVQ